MQLFGHSRVTQQFTGHVRVLKETWRRPGSHAQTRLLFLDFAAWEMVLAF